MPPWFIDIESATEMEAKSNGTPPASRTPRAASRANWPSNALQGVTRPSVDAMPTKGFPRSASERPRLLRNARCGARSRPSTVMREGSFFVFTHDLLDGGAVRQAELGRALGKRRLRHGIHQLLQLGIRLEAHLALRFRLHRVPHLLRAHADAGEEDGATRPEPICGQLHHLPKGGDDSGDRDARHPSPRLNRAH